MGNCCSSKRAEENKKYANMEKKVDDSCQKGCCGSSTASESVIKMSTQSENLSDAQKALHKRCEEYLDTHFPEPKDKSEIVDSDNYMNFKYFIKVYETALAWNKALFEESK